MDDQKISRVSEILNTLQPEFSENQKPLNPVLQSLEYSVRRVETLAFKLYREKCKESFEELEKHVKISANADMTLKKNECDSEQIKNQINKLMKCIGHQNPEFAKANKKLKGERKRFSLMYMKCNQDCTVDAPKKRDKEISDCFLNCHKHSLADYGQVSNELLKDFGKLVSSLEKL